MRSSVTVHSALKFIPLSETGWKKSILRIIGTQCQSMAVSRPRVYLLLAVTFALIGYLYLLMFPWLVFRSSFGLYEGLFKSQILVWSHLLFWLAVAAVSSLVSYRILRFRPAFQSGMLIGREAAPSLFQLVAHQAGHYGTKVDRIVLSARFEIDIVKTPRCALPVWSSNTLVIGLPLIQCLSDSRFQCALARRLGQFSKRHNWLENWLYQLRTIWPQYCQRDQGNVFGYQPVRWFFLLYAPVFKVITVPAAHLDELAADNYAMELFNEEEVLDTIASQMVCYKYLADCYWPLMRKVALSKKESVNDLHSTMASVLRNILQSDKVAHWLARTLSAEARWNDARPLLVRRLDNIGHTQARMSTVASMSAASVYLGPAFDKLRCSPEDKCRQEKQLFNNSGSRTCCG
ncbi:MAG: hypothetical protein ABFS24_11530 [Pseudomonadota bacterium]